MPSSSCWRSESRHLILRKRVSLSEILCLCAITDHDRGVAADVGKNAVKNKKKRERKLKKEGAEKDAEVEPEQVQPKISVNVTSDVEIKLTGNQEIDKQLKDLKKVRLDLLRAFISDYFIHVFFILLSRNWTALPSGRRSRWPERLLN